jgi:hypothetical protein
LRLSQSRDCERDELLNAVELAAELLWLRGLAAAYTDRVVCRRRVMGRRGGSLAAPLDANVADLLLVESGRTGLCDYASAWRWALSLDKGERAARFAAIVSANRRSKRSHEYLGAV